MKKTFPVNINGKIFYIDEDAYKLLQDYLSQLRATFPGQEGTRSVATSNVASQNFLTSAYSQAQT